MYFGISKQYLPHISTEAKFADFKNFRFAFSFPMNGDETETAALEPFNRLARKNGFELKRSYFGAHDSTILNLATKMPIAVTTTNIPAQFEGIKFIRISDWTAYDNVYFLYLKGNRKKTLVNLKKTIREYAVNSETKHYE